MVFQDIKIKIDKREVNSEIYDSLEKVKISSSLEAIDMAKIRLISNNDDNYFEEDESIDIGREITISINSKKEFIDVFIGEIIRIDYNFTDRRNLVFVDLICYSKLFKLSKIRHIRAFVEMKDSDIAKEMASEAGLQSKIDPTKKIHKYLFQNNESNLDFLRRRAEKLGYEITIEDGILIFKEANFKNKKSILTLWWGEDLIEFKVQLDSSEVIEEVVVSSWNPLTKEKINAVAKAGDEFKVVSNRKLATKEIKEKLKNKSTIYKVDIPNIEEAEALEIGKNRLTSSSMKFVTAKGISIGEANIRAGKVITINGIGKKFTGDYYITSCEHIYLKREYKTFFEVVSNGVWGK